MPRLDTREQGRGLGSWPPWQVGEGTSVPGDAPSPSGPHPASCPGVSGTGDPEGSRRLPPKPLCARLGKRRPPARDPERQPWPDPAPPAPGTLLTTELRQAGSQAGRGHGACQARGRTEAGRTGSGQTRAGTGAQSLRARASWGRGRCQGWGTWTGYSLAWAQLCDESGQAATRAGDVLAGPEGAIRGSPALRRGCWGCPVPQVHPPKPAPRDGDWLPLEMGSVKRGSG